MDQDAIDLTFALYTEHRQRTRHDCRDGTERARLNVISCDVCMYLDTLMTQAQKAMQPPEPEQSPEPDAGSIFIDGEEDA